MMHIVRRAVSLTAILTAGCVVVPSPNRGSGFIPPAAAQSSSGLLGTNRPGDTQFKLVQWMNSGPTLEVARRAMLADRRIWPTDIPPNDHFAAIAEVSPGYRMLFVSYRQAGFCASGDTCVVWAFRSDGPVWRFAAVTHAQPGGPLGFVPSGSATPDLLGTGIDMQAERLRFDPARGRYIHPSGEG